MPKIAEGVEWETSPDDLRLYLRVSRLHESIPTDDAIRALERAGVQAKIDWEGVASALENPPPDPVVIAAGTSPSPPVHGRLEYFVDPGSLDRAPTETEDGRVDYKNLRLFINVKQGEQLVRKHDPVPGQPGVDVFGKTIPPEEAQKVTLPTGPGVKIVEDGYLCVAEEDGAVTVAEGRMSVMRIFTVVRDVTYKTGNIDFNGTIEVGRDVLSGFRLKAHGDIVVRGTVEAAVLEAEGNIHIFGGFQGGKRGRLVAGGTIRCRYANDGVLEAGGDVQVRTHLLNCAVTAGGAVELESPAGVLAGGAVTAGKLVESAAIGTDAGVRTDLYLGLDHDLPDKILKLRDDLSALIKAGRPLGSRQKELEAMQKELLEAWEGKVVARRNVYPGVTIHYPGAKLEVKDTLTRRTFICGKGKIQHASESA